MWVQDVMTHRPVRIQKDATVARAVEIIVLSYVSDIMVVDSDQVFAGVLSEGDILRAAMPELEDILESGGTNQDAYALFVKNAKALSERPIAPFVIRDPITVHPSDHIA